MYSNVGAHSPLMVKLKSDLEDFDLLNTVRLTDGSRLIVKFIKEIAAFTG